MDVRFPDSKHIARAALVGGMLAMLAACALERPADKCATVGCGAAHDEPAMVEKITTALRGRPGIEFWEVRVQYISDIVYLYGIVATTPERIDIEQIARETSGGKKVVNSIEIRSDRF